MKPDEAIRSFSEIVQKAQDDAAKVAELGRKVKALNNRVSTLTRQRDESKARNGELLKKLASYQAQLAEARDRARPLQIVTRPGPSVWDMAAGECRPWAKAVTA